MFEDEQVLTILPQIKNSVDFQLIQGYKSQMEEAVKNAEAAEERLRNALREKERATTQLLSLRRNAAKLFRSVQEVCTCPFFFYSSAKLWLLVPFTWANRLVHGLQFGQMERKIQDW